MFKQLLIVEDLSHVLEWEQLAVKEAFPDAQVMSATDCQQAYSLIQAHDFDLVLLDIGLPDGSGLDLVTPLLQKKPTSIIIISTLFDDDAHLFKALRLGAKGYILKDESKQQMAQMLQNIEAGHFPISPGVANKLLAFFTPQPMTQKLTPRELEVLTCVAKGLSVPESAKILSIKNNTCYGYIKSIYQKLNINSRAEAALEATKMGLVDPRDH